MLTSVHGQATATDQYTGLTFAGNKRFKIPNIQGKWCGCYGSPTTALAGLATYIAEKRELISKDLEHELMDQFQASLRRDPAVPGTAPSRIIEKAPDYHLLETFGGNMTVSAYNAQCHYDYLRSAWNQEIHGDGAEDSVAADSKKKDEPNVWYETTVPAGKAAATSTRVKMPRCCKAFLSFLREVAKFPFGELPAYPLAVVVYFDPRNVNNFALGHPSDFGKTPNTRGTDILHGFPISGTVRVYSRTAVKLGSEKKKKHPSKVPRATGTGPVVKITLPEQKQPDAKRQKMAEVEAAAAAPSAPVVSAAVVPTVPDVQEDSQEEELSEPSDMDDAE